MTLTGFSNTLGVLFAYSVAPFVSYGVVNWISLALCGLYLVLVFFFVTETAVYQVMKGKIMNIIIFELKTSLVALYTFFLMGEKL